MTTVNSAAERCVCVGPYNVSVTCCTICVFCRGVTALIVLPLSTKIDETSILPVICFGGSLRGVNLAVTGGKSPEFGMVDANANCPQFLANVIRELTFTFAIRCRPSVCLSVVCNARARYSGSSNFRQYFYGIWYLGHPLTSSENFTEIVPGEPPCVKP